jgi:hypothetical protein
MGRIVIVGYRPKPGKAEELRALAAEHVPILRAEGLVTDRPAVLMEARDGTLVRTQTKLYRIRSGRQSGGD